MVSLAAVLIQTDQIAVLLTGVAVMNESIKNFRGLSIAELGGPTARSSK